MKCWKCSSPAVVHLTDLLKEPDGTKRPVEVHLCLAHAVEAGFPVASPELVKKLATLGQQAATKSPTVIKPTSPADTQPTAIVPTTSTAAPSGGLTVSRKDPTSAPIDTHACPVCGLSYSQFKTTGLLGCSHDYVYYEPKLTLLIKRAQENFTQHAGKVPTRHSATDPARTVTVARLRRELAQALECENYEQAAKVRDQLKQLNAA